jgi:hypothetical protein
LISYASVLPWFIPGAAASLLIAVSASHAFSRWLGTSRAVAVLLITGAGIVIAATLTPTGPGSSSVPAVPAGECDVSRIGLAPLSTYLSLNDVSLNVVLFVPLGVAIALLPRSSRSFVILAAAIASPFVIELVQSVTPTLGRSCQTGDIVDNLAGLLIGIAGGQLVKFWRTSP